jgi:glycosyltransferase involved in cell wall biosynthesis
MLGKTKIPGVCVITPYFKESRALIERCLTSVQRQTVKADHIVVADGFPQSWIDDAGLRHIKLDRAHADYGNMARGLAALMAIGEKYDAIAFLDADNWYAGDHLETCLSAHSSSPDAAYVIARRQFVRQDGSPMPLSSGEDFPLGDHVDTNCYLFLPQSYFLLHYWCTLPQEFSAQGDRLFRMVLKSRLPDAFAIAAKSTVNYTCMFSSVYRNIGETPPEGAKPGVDWRPGVAWLKALTRHDLPLVDQLSGLNLSSLAAA